MVKLFNISRNSKYIFANYLPVGYESQGAVKVRLSDGKCIEWKEPEGDAGHPWFAKFAVKKLRDLLDKETVPTEATIAWY